jgi:hypothetical protein
LHRSVGDPEVDSLLEHLASADADADGGGGGGGCGAFDDVVAFASEEYRLNANSPSCMFVRHYSENVPCWVDFDQIQRGIDVFLAYLPAAGCALFHRSLVGGFSIPRIARVLVATRYLVPSPPGAVAVAATPPPEDGGAGGGSERAIDDRDRRRSAERLLDTGGFLACCFAPPIPPSSSSSSSSPGAPATASSAAASLRPGGRGWEAALRVRILHAKVRRSLLLRGRGGSGADDAWDVDENGVPINQEDVAATLLAFSVNVLLGIEISAGRPLDATDQRDYLALWRYLGWLLGVDTPEGCGGSEGRGGSSNAPVGVEADGRRRRLAPIDPCGPRRLGGAAGDAVPPSGGRSGHDPTDDDEDYDVVRPDDDDENDVHPDDDPIIHSYATLESMVLHLLHPDATSRYLVNHLLGLRPRSVIFRSEVCRKFLGDPLSDELGIARSTASWSGWRWASLRDASSHVYVKFLLHVFLVVLRGYTLLTMTCPWFRRRAIAWHGSLEGKFLRVWEKSHEGRVTKASTKQKNGSASSNATTTKSSHCPFAMIMDPVVVDNFSRC